MENLMKRIAYLQGLSDGFDIDTDSKEGILLLEVIDLLADLVDEVKESQEELEEYVDIIEEDLSTLEDYVYDDDDFDDFDLYDDDYDLYDFSDNVEEDLFYDDLEDNCNGECNCCDDEHDN